MPITRRDFIARSAGWTVLVVTGCGSRRTAESGRRAERHELAAIDSADPIDEAPVFGNVSRPGTLPFSRDFLGDDFRRPHDLIIDPTAAVRDLPGGKLPAPDEKVPLVVVGGGVAGLGVAHLLRDVYPVVLEQAPRFGGNAKGERWKESVYALGAAYYIQPEEGDDLDRIYAEIGLKGQARRVEGHDPVEFQGTIYRRFFDGEAGDEAAFATYRKKLHHHAENAYPDIPVTGDADRALVDRLDRRTLKDLVSEWLGGKVPASLAAALQNYCWSSMGAGWQEVSAAGAVNFLAAEESGILVHPGGNAALTRALYRSVRGRTGPGRMRAGSVVFSVQTTTDGVLVGYADAAGRVHSLLARAAVLACPKFAVKHMIEELESDRMEAIDELKWRGYLVVNVLVRRAIADEFYDMYLLRDGSETARLEGRATDVILGNWARLPGVTGQSVLTLYWPLPSDEGREKVLFPPGAWERLRGVVEEQTLWILTLLGLSPDDVEQVRMVRWGHAVPVSSVGFIANGHADVIRRPIGDRIFFVNQDNWALPAVETALIEAVSFAEQIRAACT